MITLGYSLKGFYPLIKYDKYSVAYHCLLNHTVMNIINKYNWLLRTVGVQCQTQMLLY